MFNLRARKDSAYCPEMRHPNRHNEIIRQAVFGAHSSAWAQRSQASLFGFVYCLERGKSLGNMRIKIAPHEVENFNDERVADRIEDLISGFSIDTMFFARSNSTARLSTRAFHLGPSQTTKKIVFPAESMG
jgi:hypothetical protein